MINFSNPKSENIKYKKQIIKSITRVFNSNKYILSDEVMKLENEFAKFINTNYCIGVANGTDALEISLKSLNVGKDDEVITVSHTAPATISSIYSVGAIPKFLDIEEDYYTLDPQIIEKAITKKTKCLILVHIYGLSADIEKVKKICDKNSIFLIEDVSQAHGAYFKNKRLGSVGQIGCFSCYPTKNLGAIGDAGLITTNSKKIYNKIIKMREYGWDNKKIVRLNGRNSRLDELQAAILRVKLKFLDKDNEKRRKIAKFYFNNIKNDKIKKPIIREGTLPVFHLYVVKCYKRNHFLKYMKKKGINCGIHYKVPCHKHPGFSNAKIPFTLKNTENISNIIVSLPIYPELSSKERSYIVDIINKY